MTKKSTWKFWIGRTTLGLLIIGVLWNINLIWFKPFNIKHFYDKVYVQLIIDSPELATQIGIPVLQNGSVPLDTLEEIVNDYISEKGVKE